VRDSAMNNFVVTVENVRPGCQYVANVCSQFVPNSLLAPQLTQLIQRT
jgi:hypothetical protein